jgi:putative ABC transport system permease protein
VNTAFDNLTAYQTDNVVLTGTGDPERLRVRRLTASYFPTMRVQPILGREMRPEEDKPGGDRVVLLGEGFWDRRFGRDPKVIGQQLTLDGESYTVIGVLPSRKLHGYWRRMDAFTSLWRLEDQQGGPARRGEHPGIYAMGRLKPGRTVEQARTEMKQIADQLAQKYPDTNQGHSVEVSPLLEAYVDDVRPPLLALLVAAGLVLLIACGNIANLLLARATERFRELAVRRALGAGAWRLVRQSFTESLVLSVAGGAAGVLIAAWVTKGIEQLSFATVPRLDEASLDRTVLLFSVVLSVLTGVFFGTLPAWHASRTDVQQALREGGRGTGGGGGRLRNILVSAEVALSLVLLVGAGLMSKSLYKVLHADSGFDPANVMAASVSLPDSSYRDESKSRAFIRQLVEKVQAVPGVEAAGFRLPLLGSFQASILVEGRPIPRPEQMPSTDFARVTPDVFRAMGMRLLSGRPFDDHDNENAPLVCIVDETLVRQFWPGEDPLGKRLSIDGPPRPGQPMMWRTVVGVVAHVKNYGVDQPSRVETYLPFAQRPAQGGALVVRSTLHRAGLVAALRTAVRSVDPNVPLFDMRELEDVMAENTAPRRLSVLLIASFAILALILAGVGIYGVISYAVTQRTHEIGVRLAIGAERRDILRLVVGQGARLAGIGLAAGLAASAALARLLASLLFQVSPFDPEALGSVSLLLLGVALLACYLPARRATRVDPLVALRYE